LDRFEFWISFPSTSLLECQHAQGVAFGLHAVIRRDRCIDCRRRIARHKDQKNLGTDAHSVAQASDALGEKAVAQSVADCFAQTQETFTNPVSDFDSEGKAQTQEKLAVAQSGRDAFAESERNA
jgi:hypothetical protein